MSFQDGHSVFQKEVDRRVRQKVLDGIQLLQEEFGEDWVEHINLDTFDLTSGSSCVLGQVYGSWSHAVDQLDIDGKDGRYGFSTDGIGDLRIELEREGRSIWREMEDIWVDQIARLQGERRKQTV